MRLRVRVAILAACVSIAFVSAAFAQDPPKIQAGGGFMYIVYPWVAFNSPVTPDAGPSWFAKVTGHVTPYFSVVGEVAVSYYSGHGQRGIPGSARVYSVLGGGQFRPLCCATVSPFAQAVAGTMHSRFKARSETAAFADVTERPFAVAFGGGLNIQMFHVGADLMRVRHHENYSPWTWRVAAGVMFPSR